MSAKSSVTSSAWRAACKSRSAHLDVPPFYLSSAIQSGHNSHLTRSDFKTGIRGFRFIRQNEKVPIDSMCSQLVASAQLQQASA